MAKTVSISKETIIAMLRRRGSAKPLCGGSNPPAAFGQYRSAASGQQSAPNPFVIASPM